MKNPNPLPHPAYIEVYHPIGGWQTAFRTWNVEDGCYDVAGTGYGPYGHEKEGYDMAVQEGKDWAENEDVEFHEPPPFIPLKEGEPRSVTECLRQIADKDGSGLTIINLDLDNDTTEVIPPKEPAQTPAKTETEMLKDQITTLRNALSNVWDHLPREENGYRINTPGFQNAISNIPKVLAATR